MGPSRRRAFRMTELGWTADQAACRDQAPGRETNRRSRVSVTIRVSTRCSGPSIFSVVTFVRRRTCPAGLVSNVIVIFPEMLSAARARSAASSVRGFRMISAATTSDSARPWRTVSGSMAISTEKTIPTDLRAFRFNGAGLRAMASEYRVPSRRSSGAGSNPSTIPITDCGSQSIRNASQVKYQCPQAASVSPAALSHAETRASSSGRLSSRNGPRTGLRTRTGNCHWRARSSGVVSFGKSYSSSSPAWPFRTMRSVIVS